MFPKEQSFVAAYENQMATIKDLNRQAILHDYRTRLSHYLSEQKELSQKVDSHFFNIEVDITEKNPEFERRSIQYFSEEKIVVYTASYGTLSDLIEPLTVPDNCHFYVFTDQEVPEHSIWEKVTLDFDSYDLREASAPMKEQFVKMHVHLLFETYHYSLYLDPSIKVITDPTEFIERLNAYGVVFHNNYRVDCAYIETDLNYVHGEFSKQDTEKQKEYLEKQGLPKDYGFLDTSVIFRNHHHETCIAIMEEWWDETAQQATKENIMLPLILYRRGLRTLELAGLGNDIYSNYAFKKINPPMMPEGLISYHGKVTT